MPFEWKITAWKGIVTFALGGLTALVTLLSGLTGLDTNTALLVTMGISLLTMAQNWLKHRNDE